MKKWETIVLMAMNGAGVEEKEAKTQIRVITPMMKEWLSRVLDEKVKQIEELKKCR